MDLIKKNIEFLLSFRLLSDKQRSSVIRNATADRAKMIGDIAVNVVQKVLKVSDSDKTRLRRYKSVIRHISLEETNQKERLKLVRNNPAAVSTLIQTTAEKLAKIAKQ